MVSRKIWLDVDPGHDDATAILMAIHCPGIELLGVSTVHGNTSADNTASNAARCLVAFAAASNVLVYPGAPNPLIRVTKHDPEIHGEDGLGGVEGLPSPDDPRVLARFARDAHTGNGISADTGMSNAIRKEWSDGKGRKTTVIACGPQTNLALFFAVHPDLTQAVDEIVFMGGGIGLGNRSATAEFNILCDPHASQVVFDVPLPKLMVPLNVTHTAILTRPVHAQLLSGVPTPDITESDPLPPAKTPLRHTLHTLVSFFADSYKYTFNFTEGPPMHDPITIAYLVKPELFTTARYRVDVELEGRFTVGETVADIWNYSEADPESWGKGGKNVVVSEKLDVKGFFEMFLGCVDRCDAVSPLNQ